MNLYENFITKSEITVEDLKFLDAVITEAYAFKNTRNGEEEEILHAVCGMAADEFCDLCREKGYEDPEQIYGRKDEIEIDEQLIKASPITSEFIRECENNVKLSYELIKGYDDRTKQILLLVHDMALYATAKVWQELVRDGE